MSAQPSLAYSIGAVVGGLLAALVAYLAARRFFVPILFGTAGIALGQLLLALGVFPPQSAARGFPLALAVIGGIVLITLGVWLRKRFAYAGWPRSLREFLGSILMGLAFAVGLLALTLPLIGLLWR